jgi:hypothetical protein
MANPKTEDRNPKGIRNPRSALVVRARFLLLIRAKPSAEEEAWLAGFESRAAKVKKLTTAEVAE